MTQEELQDKLDDISDSCCGCGTAPQIMVLINQHVAEVIGEDEEFDLLKAKQNKSPDYQAMIRANLQDFQRKRAGIK